MCVCVVVINSVLLSVMIVIVVVFYFIFVKCSQSSMLSWRSGDPDAAPLFFGESDRERLRRRSFDTERESRLWDLLRDRESREAGERDRLRERLRERDTDFDLDFEMSRSRSRSRSTRLLAE